MQTFDYKVFLFIAFIYTLFFFFYYIFTLYTPTSYHKGDIIFPSVIGR